MLLWPPGSSSDTWKGRITGGWQQQRRNPSQCKIYELCQLVALLSLPLPLPGSCTAQGCCSGHLAAAQTPGAEQTRRHTQQQKQQ
jgi:hypothetical protein